MRPLYFLLLTLLAGCASTGTPSERPAADRIPYPDPDFSGVVATYYTTVSDTVDIAALPPKPGVRFVKANDPSFTQPSSPQPLLEQPAVREVLGGFTCPVRGIVYVSAVVDAGGAVRAPHVRSGIHEECDQRALVAMGRAVFVPARHNGEAVAALVTLPVRFS